MISASRAFSAGSWSDQLNSTEQISSVFQDCLWTTRRFLQYLASVFQKERRRACPASSGPVMLLCPTCRISIRWVCNRTGLTIHLKSALCFDKQRHCWLEHDDQLFSVCWTSQLVTIIPELNFLFAIFFQTAMTPHPKTAKSNQPPVDMELGFFLQAALQSAYLCLLHRGWFDKRHKKHTNYFLTFSLCHSIFIQKNIKFDKSADNILSRNSKTLIELIDIELIFL